MNQKPYANIGCGRIILPASRPAHHGLVDEAIYSYPLWDNIDRNPEPGVNRVLDVFSYPWPIASNSYDGALLTHIAEHCPHEIKMNIIPPYDWDDSFNWHDRVTEVERCQDGWYAFFSELHRVLTPGAVAHILSPYGWSQGALTDPSHTRYLTEHAFTHSMQPDPNSPFKYETGGLNLRLVEAARFNITEMFAHLVNNQAMLQHAIMTQINVAYELCVKLEVIK